MASGIASAAAAIGRGAGRRHHHLGARREPQRAGRRARCRPPRATAPVEDQRLQPRPAERQRLWHRRRQRLIKALAGFGPQRDAELSERLGHGQRDPWRRGFSGTAAAAPAAAAGDRADGDADRRGHNNRRRCLSSASRPPARRRRCRPRSAAGGRERRGRHPRPRLGRRRHPRRRRHASASASSTPRPAPDAAPPRSSRRTEPGQHWRVGPAARAR